MKLILMLLVGGGLATGLFQRGQITDAKKAIADARERQANARVVISDDGPSADEVVRMRTDRTELIRLRASLPELKAAARSETEVQAEIARIKKRIESERTSAKAINDSYEAQQIQKNYRQVLGTIVSIIHVTDRTFTNLPPRSFDELDRRVKESEFAANLGPTLDGLVLGYPPYFITRDHFEFLGSGPLLVRERTPRRLPDGSYLRLYLRTNMQTEERAEKTADFSAWEASFAGR